MRDYQLKLGVPREQVYDTTMYILVGLLAVGLICNLLIRPVAPKYFMTPAELATQRRLAGEQAIEALADARTPAFHETPLALVVGAWIAIGIPLAWGVYRTLQSVSRFIG
jgi:hypothetical protein